MTALLVAASEGYPEIVKTLIAKGAQLKATTVEGKTALILAVENAGDIETVKLLASSGIDVDARDEDGNTALAIAKDDDEEELVEVLRAARTKRGGSQSR
jgi:ankyrin repeat protein